MTELMAKKPPMGWNSWNTFGEKISEGLIQETADRMVDTGLLAAGYEYLVIDDCWAEMKRDKNGLLVADKEKFPGGMKALSDYIHSRGLKFGMYSCAGTKTCAGYPSSFEHEFEDARTFAEWGVDFLKYDYCNKPNHIPGDILYKRMAMALRNSGRDILFSACSWGADNSEQWMRTAGAHIWRSTGDIFDDWQHIKNIALSQKDKNSLNGPCCYNDLDMLIVGMYGKGNVGLKGCTDEEYKTHFSLWCLMASPLMIGCDIRNMNEATRNILLNKELIEINQDIEGRQAYPFTSGFWNSVNCIGFIKALHDGSYAIGFFNLDESRRELSLQFWDMGLPTASGYGFQFRDVWQQKELGIFTEDFKCVMEPHSCEVYRVRLVKV